MTQNILEAGKANIMKAENYRAKRKLGRLNSIKEQADKDRFIKRDRFLFSIIWQIIEEDVKLNPSYLLMAISNHDPFQWKTD